jgi:NAD(P)-dependent dehydrogenase (short-subunit alcohol dehydrogenase family)
LLNTGKLYRLDDRVIVLTGGAGLLGTRYARALLEHGAQVIVADLDGTAAAALQRELDSPRVISVEVDVSRPASVQAMVGRVREQCGRIDGLVNNAAIDPKFDRDQAGEHTLSFETYPLELWQQAVDVNITGAFLCAQAVAPVMLEQGQGSIVNISSIYGMVGPDQRLYAQEDPVAPVVTKPVTYSVTKAALLGLTRYLATYWGSQGIRVNTLTLGGVFHRQEEEFVRRYAWRTPLGRMARADEYSGALIFLLSDASSYMTGANLVVDGGWMAW